MAKSRKTSQKPNVNKTIGRLANSVLARVDESLNAFAMNFAQPSVVLA